MKFSFRKLWQHKPDVKSIILNTLKPAVQQRQVCAHCYANCRTFSSCKTETIPFTNNSSQLPLLLAPGNHLSTSCICEFDSSVLCSALLCLVTQLCLTFWGPHGL